jgi:hypothetical protein
MAPLLRSLHWYHSRHRIASHLHLMLYITTISLSDFFQVKSSPICICTFTHSIDRYTSLSIIIISTQHWTLFSFPLCPPPPTPVRPIISVRAHDLYDSQHYSIWFQDRAGQFGLDREGYSSTLSPVFPRILLLDPLSTYASHLIHTPFCTSTWEHVVVSCWLFLGYHENDENIVITFIWRVIDWALAKVRSILFILREMNEWDDQPSDFDVRDRPVRDAWRGWVHNHWLYL